MPDTAEPQVIPPVRIIPSISIVIPVLNEAVSIEQVCRTLADILSPRDEIIVVDGGSTDGTQAVVKQINSVLLIESSSGRAIQMNTGAEHAKGDILLFLHADTILPADFAIQLRDNFWLATNIWGRFDVRLSGNHPAFRLIEFMMNHRSRLTGICTGDQCIFVTRDDFKQVTYPVIALMEDIEISKRLNRRSKPFAIKSRAVTSSRKWESEGIFKTILMMWWIRLRFFLGESPKTLAAAYYRKND